MSNQYQYTELDKIDWIVTEKIHGANFCFIYENKKLSYGKRKENLAWNDDFFGFQLVVNKLENQIIELFEELNKNLFPQRPILKIKKPEFEENEIFHQVQKWSFIPKISSNTEELHFLVEEIRNYVTQNRLQSAISKIGSLDINNPKRVQEIENEFLRDILTDFDENNEAILKELSNQQMKWVEERVKIYCNKIINKN